VCVCVRGGGVHVLMPSLLGDDLYAATPNFRRSEG